MADPTVPLRVGIADDALLLREGISKVLEGGGIEVVASVGTGAGATRGDATTLGPRRRACSTSACRRATATRASSRSSRCARTGRRSACCCCRCTRRPNTRCASWAPAAAPGYLLKERVSEPQTLVRAVETVASGGSVVDPEVVEQLVHRTRADDPLSRLTERERSVLELMAQGYSNGGIAQTLFLGLKTVETHVRSILQKLDLEESPRAPPAGARGADAPRREVMAPGRKGRIIKRTIVITVAAVLSLGMEVSGCARDGTRRSARGVVDDPALDRAARVRSRAPAWRGASARPACRRG